MIGKLKGIIDEINVDHLIVDVHGVGYIVFASPRVLGSLPKIGEAVTLFIETQVREDAIKLFGFTTKAEKQWFALLALKQEIGEGATSQAISDAVSALENLGYSRDQAANAIASALREAGNDADSAKLIRLGLKEISR